MKFIIFACVVAIGYLVDRAFYFGKYVAACSQVLSQLAASFGLRW